MAGGHKIDPALQGPVNEHVFMVVLWIFWFLALSALVVRITVYVRARRKPQVDDYFLMLSVACLTVGTLWMQMRYGDAYETLALAVDPFKAGIPADLNKTIYRAQLVNHVYGPLIWTAIFAAKWSYLWFFKQLVQQVQPLKAYWWFVFVFTCVVYPVCLAGVFIACPYSDINAIKCNMQPLIGRALNIAIVSVALDITTDFMIVSIPVWLLWKVKIRLAQKAGLACFLCLSIVVAIMSIIRVSPLRVGDHPNLALHSIWVNMMGQVEACVAVCLVSLTAFRYFFVMQERRRQEVHEQRRFWFESYHNFFHRRHHRLVSDEEGIETLPHVPSATLSGLRSFIRDVTGSVVPAKMMTSQSTVVETESDHSEGSSFLNEKWTSSASRIQVPEELVAPCPPIEIYRIGAFDWER